MQDHVCLSVWVVEEPLLRIVALRAVPHHFYLGLGEVVVLEDLGVWPLWSSRGNELLRRHGVRAALRGLIASGPVAHRVGCRDVKVVDLVWLDVRDLALAASLLHHLRENLEVGCEGNCNFVPRHHAATIVNRLVPLEHYCARDFVHGPNLDVSRCSGLACKGTATTFSSAAFLGFHLRILPLPDAIPCQDLVVIPLVGRQALQSVSGLADSFNYLAAVEPRIACPLQRVAFYWRTVVKRWFPRERDG
mmetsp:Transcript_37539/g.94341  ORF Transcript_37539/g.94341 Transcript_37539/m.94341 type:complete len:248 (-) Transcript_37539:262-1005(-)